MAEFVQTHNLAMQFRNAFFLASYEWFFMSVLYFCVLTYRRWNISGLCETISSLKYSILNKHKSKLFQTWCKNLKITKRYFLTNREEPSMYISKLLHECGYIRAKFSQVKLTKDFQGSFGLSRRSRWNRIWSRTGTNFANASYDMSNVSGLFPSNVKYDDVRNQHYQARTEHEDNDLKGVEYFVVGLLCFKVGISIQPRNWYQRNDAGDDPADHNHRNYSFSRYFRMVSQWSSDCEKPIESYTA